MSDKITVTFTSTFAGCQDAISAAAPFLEKPIMRRIRTAQFCSIVVFTTLGIMAAILFALNYIFIDYFQNTTMFVELLAAVLLCVFLFGLSTYLDRKAYRVFTETDFAKRNTIEICPLGLTLISPHSRWFTGWLDVTETFKTEHAVGIITPSMPIFIPTDALDDPHAVFLQMQQWHQMARVS